MKNLSKSILAVLSLSLVLAACGPKTDQTSESADSVKVEETVPADTTATDTTAVSADTTVTQ